MNTILQEQPRKQDYIVMIHAKTKKGPQSANITVSATNAREAIETGQRIAARQFGCSVRDVYVKGVTP